jgi:hypothetical protein
MFWFWFMYVLNLLMIVFDAVWWVVAMRLTKSRPWRIGVSVFIAAQMAALYSLMCGLEWHYYTPKAVLAAVVIWHNLGLGFGFGIFVVLGTVRAGSWIVRTAARMKGVRPNRSVATPAGANPLTRREFFGACAALAPPLFTIGSTGVALAQLSRFRVRRFTLPIAALPRALDGITIAHVSDIHVGRLTCGRVLRRMVESTNALRADLVLMTGDLIHYDLADLAEGIDLMKAMGGRYGQWMIEGNHDLMENGTEFERRVKAAGLPLLLDESAVANVRGHPVQCFGLRWFGDVHQPRERSLTITSPSAKDRVTAFQVREVLKRRQPDAFPILLAHHPHAFDAAVKADLPLTLAGHTHGGQWMLDRQHGLGPALFRYWSGLYTRGRSQMIVSNGVGNVLPLRINAPAEIVHLTLRCA